MNEPQTPPARTVTVRTNVLRDDIAYWDRPGPGRTTVFIHGNSISKEAFRFLFEATAIAGHRLVAFDLPGCGESADAQAPEERYTLPGLGDFVVEFIRTMGIADFVLVGWSLGGHIAIESLLHGLKPAGMVLTGTPPCGPDPAEIAATFLPVAGAEVMSMERPSAEQMETFLASAFAPSVPTDALRRAALRSDGRLRATLFGHIFATPDLEPQRVTVANWPGPIALIQGRQEPFFDPAALDGLVWGNLWRGQTQWVEDAGHAPFVTGPDAYAALLKAFADDVAP
jgi:pimeloyl-ACP methyl ester carboxylesterase